MFTLKMFGNNVDGLLNKLESLEHLIVTETPSVIFLQETKMGRAGRIKTPSSKKYTFYELHRTKEAEKGERGGGLVIGVLNDLDPSWISEGDDNAEALTVEVWIEGFPIRLICGYGPQEYDEKTRKERFWQYLDQETQSAKRDGAAVVLQMDGNLWAGNGIIKRDPKKQNQNGKMFEDFLVNNPHLSVVNALPLSEGDIPRVRHQILPLLTKMTIDTRGESTLTRYRGKVVKSDHQMLKLNIDLTFHQEKKHD